ncbi:MAG: tRNA-dihydrouridine synthase family protein [Firmicutes bacterium]|nr:tRNA-dihydrouridine synthase family protein [Bacillota bacterium]
MGFEQMKMGDRTVRPALFLAPMAGLTHSAFRRLLSDFGGYGALFTEMVSSTAFLREQVDASPYTKRRACEGNVIYQFRVSGEEKLEEVFAKAATLEALSLDVNLGCPAPEIQQQASGAALFRDFPRLVSVLTRIRKVYDGTLTVKVRLGDDDQWREPFMERLRLFEEMGVAALTVHPRLSTEKLKRRARWEEFPWIAERTRLPLIGNGDITHPDEIEEHREAFAPLQGLMLGRVAVTRPWIFREFAGMERLDLDLAEVWDRLYRYTLEDFPPEKAFGRMNEFSYHFAKNFIFGHLMHARLQKARTLDELRSEALTFLGSNPERRPERGLAFT